MRENLDRFEIDTDEGRFILRLLSEHGISMTFDIHGMALEIEATVRRELRPYALEAEYARATMPPSYDPSDAYALDDPKSPGYYDRMVDDA